MDQFADMIFLQRAAADHFGLRQAGCYLKPCKRARACQCKPSGDAPPCFSHAGAPEDLQYLLTIVSRMMCDAYIGGPSTIPNLRRLEETAIAICSRAIASNGLNSRLFDRFLRRYRTPRASRTELQAFYDEVTAEQAAIQHTLEQWDAPESPC